MNAITLTEEEFENAFQAGQNRHRHHNARKRKPNTIQGLRQEGIGALAEAAVAKFLGGTWNAEVGSAHYGSDDVSSACGEFEVKATHHATGRLLVYQDTPDDRPVIMVRVQGDFSTGQFSPTLLLPGWIHAREGKLPELWQAAFKTPCYAVPQHMLRPMEELPCMQPSRSS